MLEKRIPLLYVRIKRLKLDISARDVLFRITRDDPDHPKSVGYYQHYEDKRSEL